MFQELEKESMRIAVADIGDCDPRHAELILDSVQHNILSGSLIALRKVSEMCQKDMNQWEIGRETTEAILALERHLLMIERKHK